MNETELDAQPVMAVVVDTDGVAWQKNAYGLWDAVVVDDGDYGTLSMSLAESGPLIPLVPATDSGAEQLAALRKAVTG